jgi:ATP-dependent DNA helicase 2 subunit 2
MADKEATVFIIDLGSTMGERAQGRTETNLEWAMQYVWNKINAKVREQKRQLTEGVFREKDRRSWYHRLSNERCYVT